MQQRLTTHPGRAELAAALGHARDLPASIVAGLSVMAGAFALDLLAHGAGLLEVEPVAHVAGVVGMVLTWLAVVVDGIDRPARR